jgi:hypothetical protein
LSSKTFQVRATKSSIFADRGRSTQKTARYIPQSERKENDKHYLKCTHFSFLHVRYKRAVLIRVCHISANGHVGKTFHYVAPNDTTSCCCMWRRMLNYLCVRWLACLPGSTPNVFLNKVSVGQRLIFSGWNLAQLTDRARAGEGCLEKE